VEIENFLPSNAAARVPHSNIVLFSPLQYTWRFIQMRCTYSCNWETSVFDLIWFFLFWILRALVLNFFKYHCKINLDFTVRRTPRLYWTGKTYFLLRHNIGIDFTISPVTCENKYRKRLYNGSGENLVSWFSITSVCDPAGYFTVLVKSISMQI